MLAQASRPQLKKTLDGHETGTKAVPEQLERPDRRILSQISKLLHDCETVSTGYDGGFPSSYAEHLFLYCNYMSDEVLYALLQTAADLKESKLLFIAKEAIGPEFGPIEDSHRVVSVDGANELLAYLDFGSQFYLAGMEFQWLAWAYFEPCLHIGGNSRFVDRFKTNYPTWEKEFSPWYEPGGIPECKCGVWWYPGCGDWRQSDWRCPQCSGDPVPPWQGARNSTVMSPQQLRELLEDDETE